MSESPSPTDALRWRDERDRLRTESDKYRRQLAECLELLVGAEEQVVKLQEQLGGTGSS